jgi:hypothetical protein
LDAFREIVEKVRPKNWKEECRVIGKLFVVGTMANGENRRRNPSIITEIISSGQLSSALATFI